MDLARDNLGRHGLAGSGRADQEELPARAEPMLHQLVLLPVLFENPLDRLPDIL